MMPRGSALIKRSLIFVHRWLGVALSALFLLWFVSGIVMMYWTYPEVTPQDQLRRSPPLDPARIHLNGEEAAAVLGGEFAPAQLSLTMFDGRPVYRIAWEGRRRGRGGDSTMVYADDGSERELVDAGMMDRAAAQWAGKPVNEATRQSIEEVDQWTVGGLRTLRPLFKYSWPDGQQVYVNGRTAEIVQYTTTASRFWAYLGAIPHWLYFTPLRKHPPEWTSVVVYSSLIGTVAALMGVVIGVWMYSPAKRYRVAGAATSIPYRGWKRWHTIVGLVFGLVTATWAFSGLLSMGPFPIMDRLTDLTVAAEPTEPAPDFEGALRGPELAFSVYAPKHPREAIAELKDFEVKELEYTAFDGQPMYLASNGHGDTRIVPVNGAARPSLAPDDVMRVLRQAAGSALSEMRLIDEYDAYYLDRRRERALPVIYVRLNDAIGSRYYIDPATARVAGTYSARNWVSRWLYHGLHSLDFPWLYNHRPLWDIVVITLMLGGTALCGTSIVMTWRVLMRRLAAIVPTRIDVPNEDLAADLDAAGRPES
jgi:PepSY-associated TM region